ncbi:Helix-turn-helix domain-containing protein [Geodermatophilus amargosae]|uniref:Helix-turn-helix domain-containing protein n=1 Tax=Geodermatophilus amargosae TaxID=1296565 RepID=A0A1I7CJ04_9ACTN|nr:helix-turn-helix domain-containing protein [Geodermatophilus amargosae]SFT99397.1 Helix-turn-helix domain-containing protein [Geodermatophilus amargosae]
MTSEFVVHRPHAALRGLVADAVGYRQEGLAPGTHRGLPSPTLTLVVTLGEPLDVTAHPDPAQAPGRYDALLGGLHTTPALIRHPGRQTGIQFSLSPLGARRLLGVPAGELAGLDVDLVDVLGAVGTELVDRVRAADGWPARFAAAEDVLRRAAGPAGDPAPEVAEAWRLTLAGGGRVRVGEIARRVGWSERHLTNRFRAETGLAPKEAARVARFDRARRALAVRSRPDLAGLAATGGYADQAHLTREWRAFTGLSPLRWLAAEFGFVQDRVPAVGPGSAA